MADRNEWNTKVIEEFRTNAGKVAGPFAGMPLLLLHTTGARSGQERINPMAYQADGDRLVVFASKGGAPTSPDWYHNLVAHPEVSVEVGDDRFDAIARVTEGAERDRLWTKQKADFPGFAEYETKTTREIPVVVLERVS